MATEQSKGVALVTGAGRRLGESIAQELAEQGWAVALHCHRSQQEAHAVAEGILSRGGQARVYAHDLDLFTCGVQTGSVVQTSSQWLAGIESDMQAPITLLVNNASRFAFDVPSTATGPDLMAHYQTNLVSPVLLTQALFALRGGGQPQAPQSPVGCVINLLDQKLENLNPDFFSYTLSKASLLTATQLMARSFAPVLRVVGVSPGITLPSADQTEAEFQRAHQLTPLGASSTACDIAQAVSWLASARAITGINLMVDGGQHLLSSDRDVMFKIR